LEQSLFDLHAAAQMPNEQASPAVQSLPAEHVQWPAGKPASIVHRPLAPHWLSDVQLVHEPPRQTWPLSQSLLAPQMPQPKHGSQTT
jgi:hypothetical protein